MVFRTIENTPSKASSGKASVGGMDYYEQIVSAASEEVKKPEPAEKPKKVWKRKKKVRRSHSTKRLKKVFNMPDI